VTHIHWGGGSPTMLAPDDVRKLGAALKAHFEFAPGAEFAIEIDPRGLKDEMVAALAERTRHRTLSSRRRWPCRSRDATSRGRSGFSRFPHTRSDASHSVVKASRTHSS